MTSAYTDMLEMVAAKNKVDVTLTTHDAGGLTQNDLKMAKAMNRFAG